MLLINSVFIVFSLMSGINAKITSNVDLNKNNYSEKTEESDKFETNGREKGLQNGSVRSFTPGGTVKTNHIKAWHHYQFMFRKTKNIISISQMSPIELNEYGKPIRKAACDNISTRNHCKSLFENAPFRHHDTNRICPASSLIQANADPDPAVPSIMVVDDFKLVNQILMTDIGINNHSEPGNCTVLIFYASWSSMSAKAAPYFNAIPRAFENIRFVAVDVYKHPEVISTYVIYAVPTILLFHNGKIHARFTNTSFSFGTLTNFLEKYTDQESASIQPLDYYGPIPTSAISRFEGKELTLAWLFIFVSCLYGLFTKPAFNLFLIVFLYFQSVVEDIEFMDLKG